MSKLKNALYELHMKSQGQLTTIFFLGIIYILLYQVLTFRHIIKDIFIYINGWLTYLNCPFDMEIVKKIYHTGEVLVILYFSIYILYNISIFFLFKIFDGARRKEKPKNRFEESMIRYLETNSLKQCYLLTGKWGSGKSYSVNHFFDDYYRFSQKKVYRISCFGLDSREQVEKEIESQLELNDNSMYTKCIQIIRYIPLIGEFLWSLLKRNYTIGNVKRRSIFIFDDFERVTSRGIDNKEISNGYYHKSPFLLKKSAKEYKEFDDINKEFKKIDESLSLISKNEKMRVNQVYFEKYNTIIGLLNELIETYEMKVIIVCNADILGYQYINSVFRGKLNCITYNQITNDVSIESLINSATENFIFNNNALENTIKEILLSQSDFLKESVVALFDYNLRYVETIIYAFLDTARVVENASVDNREFLENLFFSICITHILYYNNNLKYLDNIPSGGNLQFYLKLYKKQIGFSGIFDKWKIENKIKWVDITISGFWILNMSKPNNIERIIDEYNLYQHYEVEEELLCGDVEKLENRCQNLRLEHVLYMQNYCNKDHKDSFDRFLSKVDFKEENVDSECSLDGILCLVNSVFGEMIYNEFEKVLYSKLFSVYKISNIEEKTYSHVSYNKQCIKPAE